MGCHVAHPLGECEMRKHVVDRHNRMVNVKKYRQKIERETKS